MIGLFCAKYTTFDLKKHRGVTFHDTEESCKIWKKTDLWLWKWHEEFGKFSSNTWKCQNLYFHGILLSKVENAWAITYRGVISNDTEEWWKIWKVIDLSFRNWHKEFDEFWLENLKVSKIYTLMGCVWPKFIMFELEMYRGAIFYDTRVWCKIWRRADLWFRKWHEEFGKFSPEHTKFPKLGLSLDPFIQCRKCMSLKFWGELCVTTMKNDSKLEVELTCYFEIDMRNLANFDPSTQKFQKFGL